MKTLEDAVRELGGVWPFEWSDRVMYWDKYHEKYAARSRGGDSNTTYLNYRVCTRYEFEACTRRLRNEPSWKDAPDWAVAKAQDGDGEWFWYKNIPKPSSNASHWNGGTTKQTLFASKGEVIGDWCDTLRLRPEEKKVEDKPHLCNTCVSRETCEVSKNWIRDKLRSCAMYVGKNKLPPVGAEFEFSRDGIKWEELVMLFNDGITFLVASKTCPTARWHYDCNYPGLRFRPSQTERERLIQAVLHVISEKAEGRVSAPIKLIVESLADAGMLKMPEDK